MRSLVHERVNPAQKLYKRKQPSCVRTLASLKAGNAGE